MERIKELDALRDLVYKHINEAVDIQKDRYNKNRKPTYDGPYTIIDLIAPYVYKLDMGDRRKKDIVHSSELKRFIEKRVRTSKK